MDDIFYFLGNNFVAIVTDSYTFPEAAWDNNPVDLDNLSLSNRTWDVTIDDINALLTGTLW